MNRHLFDLAFKKYKHSNSVLTKFAQILARLTAILLLPLLMISIYKNLLLDHNPAVYAQITSWLIILYIALRSGITKAYATLAVISALFFLNAVSTVFNNQELSFAPAFILMLSPWLLIHFGLNRSLVIAALAQLSLVIILYIDTGIIQGSNLIQLAVYVSCQAAILIAINLLANMFFELQTQLKTSNNLMELAASESGIGFFRYDPSQGNLEVNASYRDLLGIRSKQEPVSFKHLYETILKQDQPAFDDLFNPDENSQGGRTVELRMQTNNQIRWIRLTIRSRNEHTGLIFYGSIADVQDNHDQVSELKELRLRTLVANEAFKLGIINGTPDSKNLVIDTRAKEILGIKSPNKMVSISHEQFIDLLEASDQMDARSKIERTSSEIGEYLFNYGLKTCSGQQRWIRGVFTSYLDGDDRMTLLAVIEDITEEHLRTERLNEFSLKNKSLLEQLTLATYEADIRIIDENLTTGETEYIAKAKSPRLNPPNLQERLSIVPEEYQEAIKASYKEPGKVVEYPISGSTFLTGIQWLKLTLIRRFNVGNEEHALLMVTEITKEKKFQQQLERSLMQVEASLSRLNEIAVAGQIGLFEWSVDSEIMRPNQIFRQQTELTQDKFPVLTTFDFITLFEKAEGKKLLSELRATTPDSDTLEFQFQIYLFSGIKRWIRLTATAHQAELGGTRILGSIMDLTAQVELEQRLREANHALTHQSRTDHLTQLANRRVLDEFINVQFATRNRDPDADLSMVILDIDYFKKYNDHYGHPSGDEVLKKVARVLTQIARRPSDLVARFGGEEFVILLPNTDLAGAISICGAIKTALEKKAIEHKQSPFARITISMGISHLSPMELTDEKNFLKAADQALYEAKGAGRNRYESKKPVLI